MSDDKDILKVPANTENDENMQNSISSEDTDASTSSETDYDDIQQTDDIELENMGNIDLERIVKEMERASKQIQEKQAKLENAKNLQKKQKIVKNKANVGVDSSSVTDVNQKSSSDKIMKTRSSYLRDYYNSEIDEALSAIWAKNKDIEMDKQNEETRKIKTGLSTIPFVLYKTAGINLKPKFFNLTTSQRNTVVFYAVVHAGVLFNYRTHEQKFLLGHKNSIENISTDFEGKWLVTADIGKDNCFIVWNREDCIPISTVFDPHGNYGIAKLVLSFDAKYLVTVGNEPKPIIKFWLWTLGADEADAQYVVKGNVGEAIDVKCNMNCSSHFMVTFENQVVFVSWENNELIVKVAVIKNRKNIGKYTSSTYLLNSTTCATATNMGWVIVWGNNIYITPFSPDHINNDKVFLKAIKLQMHTITTITSVNRLYVTGDTLGCIKFYDRKMRILYWIANFNLSPIVEIGFHRYTRGYCYQDIDNTDTINLDAHLALGTSTGNFWFLHQVIWEQLTPEPYKFDNEPILNIQFSEMNNYCAYYDGAMGVCLFILDLNEPSNWKYLGRIIAHYRPIIDMLFIYYEENTRLITIGEDRYLVEYDISQTEKDNIRVLRNILIDQVAIPQSFIYYKHDDNYEFFVSDNQFKFKVYSDNTFTCKRTILAPNFDEPIRKMKVIRPPKDDRYGYALFSTKKYLGIQILPTDGNPFKYVAMIVHPTEVVDFTITLSNDAVFTFGKDDNCCCMWKLKLDAVEAMVSKGGNELEPFYCLIEGGVNGWLYKEMQDLFYYMQILNQGEDSPDTRLVTNKIELTELANLVRAIGFYPTEYELINLMLEAQEGNYNERTKVYEITFEEFVKLYLNHRPAFGISVGQLKNAFSVIAPSLEIEKDQFETLMCTMGEPFAPEDLKHCFKVLMHYDASDETKSENENPKNMPETITYDTLIQDMLGIDMNKEISIGELNTTEPD